MGQRNGFARALLVEDVSTVAAVVLSIRKGKGSTTAHAHITVSPFRRSTAVDHAARHVGLGREFETFSYQGLVDLVDICQIVPALRGTCPILYQFQYLLLDDLI